MLQQAALREIEIENPYFSPSAPAEQRRIKAVQSLRDDPLGLMHSRKQVSDSQYRAGRRWQALWAAKEVGGVRSIDLTQTPVDGSPMGFTGLSERQRQAMKEVEHLQDILGRDGYALVCGVLVDKHTIREIADAGSRMPGKATTTYVGHRFRECLSTLAKAMGYAT